MQWNFPFDEVCVCVCSTDTKNLKQFNNAVIVKYAQWSQCV